MTSTFPYDTQALEPFYHITIQYILIDVVVYLKVINKYVFFTLILSQVEVVKNQSH